VQVFYFANVQYSWNSILIPYQFSISLNNVDLGIKCVISALIFLLFEDRCEFSFSLICVSPEERSLLDALMDSQAHHASRYAPLAGRWVSRDWSGLVILYGASGAADAACPHSPSFSSLLWTIRSRLDSSDRVVIDIAIDWPCNLAKIWRSDTRVLTSKYEITSSWHPFYHILLCNFILNVSLVLFSCWFNFRKSLMCFIILCTAKFIYLLNVILNRKFFHAFLWFLLAVSSGRSILLLVYLTRESLCSDRILRITIVREVKLEGHVIG